jgi:superfamily II DNA/RNA helicase
MPRAIATLADQMLRDPAKVAVTPVASTVDRVQQRIIRVDRPAKPAVLAEILQHGSIGRALVFTRTKHGADKVVRGLAKAGISAHAIHGNKSQNQRERVLAAFRKGEVLTLVATDIASARHRRRRHQPRREFRSAERAGNLRAPHRPHRASRGGRCRDLALRLRRGGVPARHREADPHVHSSDGPPDVATGSAVDDPEPHSTAVCPCRRQTAAAGPRQRAAQARSTRAVCSTLASVPTS